MKRKLFITGVIFAVLFVFLCLPLSRYPISLAVMKIYSGLHERDSLMEKKGISLEIPGGGTTEEKDWYPFVMTFNDSAGFRQFIREKDGELPYEMENPLELTILYNFPAFDILKGCSDLYNPQSPYYNSFYGAYLVSGRTAEGGPYGFSADGSLDLEATSQVPQFDFQRLVLTHLGIRSRQQIFDWKMQSVRKNVDYGGSSGWTRVDASLITNGVIHRPEGFQRSYLQYGSCAYVPKDYGMDSFAPVSMRGRLYGKYFADWDTSIFFYIMAADEDVLESCDAKILSKSVLK
ncbi:Uncharacterised protein [uncultured Eubacterium sp.]|nr:Uncharacterised protein [uncultured Eubacterium sp.]